MDVRKKTRSKREITLKQYTKHNLTLELIKLVLLLLIIALMIAYVFTLKTQSNFPELL